MRAGTARLTAIEKNLGGAPETPSEREGGAARLESQSLASMRA